MPDALKCEATRPLVQPRSAILEDLEFTKLSLFWENLITNNPIGKNKNKQSNKSQFNFRLTKEGPKKTLLHHLKFPN